jgi:hypothetical protein
MIEEIKYVPASDLRAVIGELTQPDQGVVYVVTRRERPLMLIWPARGLTDKSAMNVRLMQAVKARNALGDVSVAVPEVPVMISQTKLRRSATAFYLQISSSQTPGLITHYGQRAALFVPVNSVDAVNMWVKTMNDLLH